MGCPVGTPSCSSTVNQGLQCTNQDSFNCLNPNTVCLQYQLTASGGKQSKCLTNCTAGSSFNSKAACTAANGPNIWASTSLCTGGNLAELCGGAGCSTIDTSRCMISGTSPTICAGELGGNFSEIFIQGPTERTTRPNLDVTCQWDITEFNTVEAVNAYIAQFGKGGECKNPPCPPGVNNVYNEIIMPHFCSLADTNTPQNRVCPVGGPAGAWVGEKCSRMISNSEAGNLCTEWINNINNITDLTAVDNANSETFRGYCNQLALDSKTNTALQGGEINECVCINRGKGGATGLWGQVTQAASETGINIQSQTDPLGPVGCWYTPCNDAATQLVFKNSGNGTTIQKTYYPDNCPNVCQIINNIQGKITNSTFKESINCKGGGGGTGGNGGTGGPTGGGTTGGGNGGGTTDGADGDQKSFWERYRWWIIGVGIAVILLIIIIIIVVVTTGGKKKPKTKGINPALTAAILSS